MRLASESALPEPDMPTHRNSVGSPVAYSRRNTEAAQGALPSAAAREGLLGAGGVSVQRRREESEDPRRS